MAETRSHHFLRQLDHEAPTVFEALVTPSQIRSWWSAKQVIVIPKVDGLLCATWGPEEDVPEFTCFASIKVFEPNERLVFHKYKYASPEGGLPFEANFETTFEIRPTEKGVNLTVDQNGFPTDSVADEYYLSCEQGWKDTLDSLERFLRVQAL